MVGYRDVAYFGSTFKKLSGLSPRSIRTAAGRTRKLHKKYGTYRTSSADFHSISQKCPHNRRLVPFRAGAAEGIMLYVVFYAATTNEGEQR